MSSPQLAITVVQTLIAQGVRHVVLCPGSRNAPLALALACADRAGLVELVVRLDERTAGFMALGIAKASGRPVAVCTTSGTAVANLHPAVLEARHAAVPLVVLSADRPLSARRSGANQTTEQDQLFGSAVLDASLISSQSGDAEDWRFALRRSLVIAEGTRSRQPGPVHLNLALAEPLVDPALLDELCPGPPEDELLVDAAQPAPAHGIAPGPRTVVLAGDADPATGRAARRFAEAAGVPLLAEPSSNARAGALAMARYVTTLRSDLAQDIERVVVFGHPTLSRPVTTLLRRPEVEVIVVAEHAQWNDLGHRATRIVDQVEPTSPGDRRWLDRWVQADRQAVAAADQGQVWGRAAVAAEVMAQLGPGQVLVVGSSQVIRDLDAAPITESGAMVYANRGLAGIDGTISTAVGIRMGSELPTTCLLGDLATLHDLGGFVHGEQEAVPGIRIVVVDDHGGGIFATLEQGAPDYADHFARVFATPQRVDLAPVLTALGAGVTTVSDVDALRAELAGPIPEQGWQVVIARVAPVSAQL